MLTKKQMVMKNKIETIEGFTAILDECKKIRTKKRTDYGTSWKILRASSITDQIFIKAQRIRTIQETKKNLVGDSIENEFTSIINYCLMALYVLKNASVTDEAIDEEIVFDGFIDEILKLLANKNHDYGEAWREMRISSMTDLILMKLLRLKQIEDNNYKVSSSEEAHASYQDIVNYAVFCLIRIKEGS